MNDENSNNFQSEQTLDEISAKNEKARLDWARREARKGAINQLHEQASTGLFNESGLTAWEAMSVDQQSEFMETKKLPSDFEFSHLFSAQHYQEVAHDPASGRLTPRLDHLYGDHGGNTQIQLDGEPRDPNWRDSWGIQEVDSSSRKGQEYLGMSGDGQSSEEKLDAQLKKDYREFFNQSTSQNSQDKIEDTQSNESRRG